MIEFVLRIDQQLADFEDAVEGLPPGGRDLLGQGFLGCRRVTLALLAIMASSRFERAARSRYRRDGREGCQKKVVAARLEVLCADPLALEGRRVRTACLLVRDTARATE